MYELGCIRGRYVAGLEVAPRSPKRDAGVMNIRGLVEQFSYLIKDTSQQGKFQEGGAHDCKVPPRVASVNRGYGMPYSHRGPSFRLFD